MTNTPDLLIREDGERVTVQSNTEEGAQFVDSWNGPLLEVLDSGLIVIPREGASQFTSLANDHDLVMSDGDE